MAELAGFWIGGVSSGGGTTLGPMLVQLVEGCRGVSRCASRPLVVEALLVSLVLWGQGGAVVEEVSAGQGGAVALPERSLDQASDSVRRTVTSCGAVAFCPRTTVSFASEAAVTGPRAMSPRPTTIRTFRTGETSAGT